jgi:hypothetical protein
VTRTQGDLRGGSSGLVVAHAQHIATPPSSSSASEPVVQGEVFSDQNTILMMG